MDHYSETLSSTVFLLVLPYLRNYSPMDSKRRKLFGRGEVLERLLLLLVSRNLISGLWKSSSLLIFLQLIPMTALWMLLKL